MTELFDTTGMRDDHEHWDSLAARVTRSALARGDRGNELMAFAGSWSGWLAATILAGIAAGVILLSRSGVAGGSASDWGNALQPSDDIGRSITAAATPPFIGALLLNAERSGRPQ